MAIVRPSPTLYDVAREAGVSLSTASRALNGSSRRVDDAYRRRVLEAAERLGYSANVAAQSVARGATRTIVLLVSDISDPFFALIAAGVMRAADDAGFLVSVAITERDTDREMALVRTLRGHRPSTILLAGSRSTGGGSTGPRTDAALVAELETYEQTGGRVVTIAQELGAFASVTTDDVAAGRDLGRALLELGYRHPIVLGGPAGLVTAERRLRGVGEAFAGAGSPIPADRIVRDGFDRDSGERQTAALLAAGLGDADVLVAVNDVMAIGALAALRAAGVGVPEAIGVAGFDDIPPAQDAAPALTTVRLPLVEAGELAVRIALDADGPRIPQVLGTRVVLRGSTRRR